MSSIYPHHKNDSDRALGRAARDRIHFELGAIRGPLKARSTYWGGVRGGLPPLMRQRREAGMVAIMVTLVLMIVISLIVLGFAQISRRNQRQALDRQLSTQAFYAAETGVNDAAELIKTAVASGTAVATKPDCASNGGGFYATLSPVIDAAANVQYTCLMVDPAPTTLVYNSVGPDVGTIVPINVASGTIASLELIWESKDDKTLVPDPSSNCPSSGLPTANVFSPTGSGSWGNCGYGVLRFDLVPTSGPSLSLSGLQAATMTSFVIPLRAGAGGATASPVGYSTGGANSRFGIVCSAVNCQLVINNLTQGQYHLRLSSLYKEVSMQIRAFNGSGTALQIQGAQAVVDATGKAQDVLRRIQVRVPLSGNSSNQLSDYAIQSTEAICKRFSVMDGYFQSDANTALTAAGFPGLAASNNNPLCD